MTLLPYEIILIILKHRKNISWNIRKSRTHKKLSDCLVTLHVHQNTNFDFRGYWITWFQGPRIEITISQRPDWVVMSYVYSIPKPDPEQIGIETQKVVYCPMFHLE